MSCEDYSSFWQVRVCGSELLEPLYQVRSENDRVFARLLGNLINLVIVYWLDYTLFHALYKVEYHMVLKTNPISPVGNPSWDPS